MTTAKILDESPVRGYMSGKEGATEKTKEGHHDWANRGSFQGPVIDALRQFAQLTGHLVKGSDNVVKWIKNCTRAAPGVAWVNWWSYSAVNQAWGPNGYAHWVVCVGIAGGNAIFLDPEYGLVEVPQGDLTRYSATNNAGGTDYGYIDSLVQTMPTTTAADPVVAQVPAAAARAAGAVSSSGKKLPPGAVKIF